MRRIVGRRHAQGTTVQRVDAQVLPPGRAFGRAARRGSHGGQAVHHALGVPLRHAPSAASGPRRATTRRQTSTRRPTPARSCGVVGQAPCRPSSAARAKVSLASPPSCPRMAAAVPGRRPSTPQRIDLTQDLRRPLAGHAVRGQLLQGRDQRRRLLPRVVELCPGWPCGRRPIGWGPRPVGRFGGARRRLCLVRRLPTCRRIGRGRCRHCGIGRRTLQWFRISTRVNRRLQVRDNLGKGKNRVPEPVVAGGRHRPSCLPGDAR